nr:Uncharacterised protein [Klebsiella pneumoniae]
MSVAASAKVVTCACIIIKASSTASAKVSPPMPKPLVTVRITGLAMISPTELARVVGKPTTPRSRWLASLLLNIVNLCTIMG